MRRFGNSMPGRSAISGAIALSVLVVVLVAGTAFALASTSKVTDAPAASSTTEVADSLVAHVEASTALAAVETIILDDGSEWGAMSIDSKDLEKSIEEAPDMIPVWNRDGSEIAGYVAADALFSGVDNIQVVGLDRSVVGSWINGKGFVGVDEDAALVDSSGWMEASE